MTEVKVYGNRPNANRRMKQLADKYPKSAWDVVVPEDGNGFVIRATTSKVGAKELAEEPVLIYTPSADERKEARAAEKEAVRAEKLAAKQAAKEAKDAAKAAKPKRTKRESNGEESKFATAVANAQAKIAAGTAPFRAGSKRDQLREMLEKGITVERAMEKLSFARNTVLSGLHSTAKLMGRKITKDDSGKYRFAE